MKNYVFHRITVNFQRILKQKSLDKYQFFSPDLRLLWANITAFNPKFYHYNIRGKLATIRCEKQLLKNSLYIVCLSVFKAM